MVQGWYRRRELKFRCIRSLEAASLHSPVTSDCVVDDTICGPGTQIRFITDWRLVHTLVEIVRERAGIHLQS